MLSSKFQDLNDPCITCGILAHDVPHVPGLSCRLLSVDQWNAARGEIWFHPQHTTLRDVDIESGEAHSFSVAKPFTPLRNIDGLPSTSSQTQHRGIQHEEAYAGIQSVATVAKKRPIPSDLLHRRLGHRTVNAMMFKKLTSSGLVDAIPASDGRPHLLSNCWKLLGIFGITATRSRNISKRLRTLLVVKRRC